MKKALPIIIILTAISLFIFFSPCRNSCKVNLAPSKLLIDGFEGTVQADDGAGNGANCLISFPNSKEDPLNVHSGKQSMKINYDKTYGGYMFCARGFGLKPVLPKPEEELIWEVKPEEIDFSKYNAFGFYFKGENTGNEIAVDMFDAKREMFRYKFIDDSQEWKEIVIPFADFKPREDYQPDWNNCDKKIDFPVVTYQFEALGSGKKVKGNIYIDTVHFDKIN